MKDFRILINVGKRAQVFKPNCLRHVGPGEHHFGQRGVEVGRLYSSGIICRFAAVAVCERVKPKAFGC